MASEENTAQVKADLPSDAAAATDKAQPVQASGGDAGLPKEIAAQQPDSSAAIQPEAADHSPGTTAENIVPEDGKSKAEPAPDTAPAEAPAEPGKAGDSHEQPESGTDAQPTEAKAEQEDQAGPPADPAPAVEPADVAMPDAVEAAPAAQSAEPGTEKAAQEQAGLETKAEAHLPSKGSAKGKGPKKTPQKKGKGRGTLQTRRSTRSTRSQKEDTDDEDAA